MDDADSTQESPLMLQPRPERRVPEIPAHIRPLLGDVGVLEHEDRDRYERVMAEVGDAVGARDLVDWWLVRDMVAISWQIEREQRRLKHLVHVSKRDAVEHLLRPLLVDGELGHLGKEKARSLATGFAKGSSPAISSVKGYLARLHLSLEDVAAQALALQANAVNDIHRRLGELEKRRTALLGDVQRRRAWEARVQRVTAQIIETEFAAIGPLAP